MIKKESLYIIIFLLFPVIAYCQNDVRTKDTILIINNSNHILSAETEIVFITVKHSNEFFFQEQTFDKAAMTIKLYVEPTNYEMIGNCKKIYSYFKHEIMTIRDSNGVLIYSKSDTNIYFSEFNSGNIIEQINDEIELLFREATVSYCYQSNNYPQVLLFYLSTPLLRTFVRKYLE